MSNGMIPSQNLIIPDELQSINYLSSPHSNNYVSPIENDSRNVDYHISSSIASEYPNSLRRLSNRNDEMMPSTYSLPLDRFQNNYKQIQDFSIPLTSPVASFELATSSQTMNPILMQTQSGNTQLLESKQPTSDMNCEQFVCPYLNEVFNHDNSFQQYSATIQQHMLSNSHSLSPLSSSRAISSFLPSTKIQTKYTFPVEQYLSSSRSTPVRCVLPNYSSSLSLRRFSNTLMRPDKYYCPASVTQNLPLAPLSCPNIRLSPNFSSNMIYSYNRPMYIPQPLISYPVWNTNTTYPTMEQLFNYQKFLYEQLAINSFHANNSVYNQCLFRSDEIPINAPNVCYTSYSPTLNTTLSSTLLSTSAASECLLEDKKDMTPRNSITETPAVRRRIEKLPKTSIDRTRMLIKRIKRRNKLAVLKLMMQKQKRNEQKLSKNTFSEVKIDPSIGKPLETNSIDINGVKLKIIFDASQQIDTICLYYHKRDNNEIKQTSPCVTPRNNTNKLDLLIEAIEFIEKSSETSKLSQKPN